MGLLTAALAIAVAYSFASLKVLRQYERQADWKLPALAERYPCRSTDRDTAETEKLEWVTPGQPVLVLADLDHLRVETTDLSERDVPKIEIGQPVRVLVEALNEEISGQVLLIAPLADILGGDVVYKTTIVLDTQPPGLRPGMSVEVQFGTTQ